MSRRSLSAKRYARVPSILTVALLLTISVLLTLSVAHVRRALEALSNASVTFDVLEVRVRGLEIQCTGVLRVTSLVPYEVEIVQVRIVDSAGGRIATRALEAVVPNEAFTFTLRDPTIFSKRETLKNLKLLGFARLNFKVGRYGVAIDFPLSSSVKALEET